MAIRGSGDQGVDIGIPEYQVKKEVLSGLLISWYPAPDILAA